jgi:hypothetical protein
MPTAAFAVGDDLRAELGIRGAVRAGRGNRSGSDVFGVTSNVWPPEDVIRDVVAVEAGDIGQAAFR